MTDLEFYQSEITDWLNQKFTCYENSPVGFYECMSELAGDYWQTGGYCPVAERITLFVKNQLDLDSNWLMSDEAHARNVAWLVCCLFPNSLRAR